MTNKGSRCRLTKSMHAVCRIEDRMHDARSKGDWLTVERLEKELRIAQRRHTGLVAKNQTEEYRYE